VTFTLGKILKSFVIESIALSGTKNKLSCTFQKQLAIYTEVPVRIFPRTQYPAIPLTQQTCSPPTTVNLNFLFFSLF
jgi:hypothetical protein